MDGFYEHHTGFGVVCVFFVPLGRLVLQLVFVFFKFPSIFETDGVAKNSMILVDTCRFGGFSVPLSQQQKHPGWTV